MEQKHRITKKDAETQAAEVRESLKQVFPSLVCLIENTPVYLISNKDSLLKRNQIAAEIKADDRNSIADTAAEVLVGKDGTAIIVYYSRIDEHLFKHYLRHEFGHVVFISVCRDLFEKVRRDIAMDKDTPIRNGAALWTELIAEVFAYRAEGNSFCPCPCFAAEQAERFMDEAVNTGAFNPYPMAFYLAMFFEDPEILYYQEKHPNAAVGANHCDDEIMPIIERTLNIVIRLLDKDDFWIISEEELTSVGHCVNELWDYCWRRKDERLFERLSDLLKG